MHQHQREAARLPLVSVSSLLPHTLFKMSRMDLTVPEDRGTKCGDALSLKDLEDVVLDPLPRLKD